jgi:hypothetical protein
MRMMKTMMTLGIAVALMLGAGVALAAQPAYRALTKAEQASGAWQPVTYPQLSGKVTAITTQSPTMLTIQIGKDEPRVVRVALNGQTMIRQGLFAERPADIQVGSHVWVDYERVQGKRVADRVRILDPMVRAMREPEGPDYR